MLAYSELGAICSSFSRQSRDACQSCYEAGAAVSVAGVRLLVKAYGIIGGSKLVNRFHVQIPDAGDVGCLDLAHVPAVQEGFFLSLAQPALCQRLATIGLIGIDPTQQLFERGALLSVVVAVLQLVVDVGENAACVGNAGNFPSVFLAECRLAVYVLPNSQFIAELFECLEIPVKCFLAVWATVIPDIPQCCAQIVQRHLVMRVRFQRSIFAAAAQPARRNFEATQLPQVILVEHRRRNDGKG